MLGYSGIGIGSSLGLGFAGIGSTATGSMPAAVSSCEAEKVIRKGRARRNIRIRSMIYICKNYMMWQIMMPLSSK